MKNLLHKLFIGSLAIISLQACNTKKLSNDFSVPKDQFAFIEYYQTTDGRIIQGQKLPGKRIDFPTYTFDLESKVIRSRNDLNFSGDTVQVLLGTGKVLKGAAGSGVSSVLIGIKKLPYSYSELEIVAVDSKTMSIKYGGENITLAVGEELKRDITTRDTIHLDEIVIVEKTVENRIVFHGFIPKSSLNRE